MKIKIKEKPSKRRIYFEDLNIGDIFRYKECMYIVVRCMTEKYGEDRVINAINLNDGGGVYFEDNEVVEKYMGDVLEIEDKFEEWI